MAKSRKNLKRRNLSKKKTFLIYYKGFTRTVKAMDSRCALSKALLSFRKQFGKFRVNTLQKDLAKIDKAELILKY